MRTPQFAILFIIVFLLTFGFCTPYDSNRTNSELIQGRWLLVDIEHLIKEYDTIDIDVEQNTTYLLFSQDSCTQYITGMDTTYFRFTISDYKLMIYKDTIFTNTLGITKLIRDSLILTQKDGDRKYIRVEN